MQLLLFAGLFVLYLSNHCRLYVYFTGHTILIYSFNTQTQQKSQVLKTCEYIAVLNQTVWFLTQRVSVREFWAGWWNCHLPYCVSTISYILMPCERQHLVFCDIWLSIQPVKMILLAGIDEVFSQNIKNDKPISNNLYNF